MASTEVANVLEAAVLSELVEIVVGLEVGLIAIVAKAGGFAFVGIEVFVVGFGTASATATGGHQAAEAGSAICPAEVSAIVPELALGTVDHSIVVVGVGVVVGVFVVVAVAVVLVAQVGG